jgi:PKD repeat protein
VSASYGTALTRHPALRRNVASSVVALLAALTIVVFILGRGPGTLVWFNGSSPTWLPFAGSGLSWLPFGHPQPSSGPTPLPQPPATSPGPVVGTSPSPSPSPSPSETPSPTPAPSPSTTLTPTPTPAPTPAPTPTPPAPTPTPTPAPTPTPTPTPSQTPGPLSASASGSPTPGPAPLTVNFSGSASGGSGTYTYAWNFGDLSTGAGQSPAHVYTARGDYLATLTVTDSANATATSTVPVSVSLGVTISATPTSGLAPLVVTLDGSATGGSAPYSYSWDFGDGSTPTTPAPTAAVSYTYTLPGSFTATLTVTDSSTAPAVTDTVGITAQQPVPTVGGVSPNAGPESGGTAVTITGTYLMNLTGVKFGGTNVPTSGITAPVCDTSGNCNVTVNSPARPEGPVDIRLTTNGGTSPIGNDQFTYFLAWSQLAANTVPSTTSPSAREGAAMVNDGAGVLMFGGYSGTTLLNETWYWSNNAWQQLALPPALAPAARANAAIAFTGSKVVLFGGACGVPVATTTCYLNDSWTWDPTAKTWTAVQANTTSLSSTQPTQRLGAVLAKDSSQRLLLFGGRDAGGYRNDSYTFTGTAWTLRTGLLTAPGVRAFGSMATDASGQVVLFGGYDATAGYLGDTWIWSGSAWRQVGTLAAPSPRKMAALAYFNRPNGGTASGLAIFGGQDASGDLGDTWTWNGTSWIPLYAAGPGQPPIRSDAMAATDTNGSILLFGGTSSGTQQNDLWRLG